MYNVFSYSNAPIIIILAIFVASNMFYLIKWLLEWHNNNKQPKVQTLVLIAKNIKAIKRHIEETRA